MFDNEEIKPNYLDEEEVQTNFTFEKSLIDQSDFLLLCWWVGTADEFLMFLSCSIN